MYGAGLAVVGQGVGHVAAGLSAPDPTRCACPDPFCAWCRGPAAHESDDHPDEDEAPGPGHVVTRSLAGQRLWPQVDPEGVQLTKDREEAQRLQIRWAHSQRRRPDTSTDDDADQT